MKSILKSLIATGLLLSSVSNAGVLTVITDTNNVPCFKPSTLAGFYVGLNVGYSWFTLSPHRPDIYNLFPLREDFLRESSWNIVPAIGYDFYPATGTPFRIEINYLYADASYTLQPYFMPPLMPDTIANDRFLVRNTLATLYFDWHTCTRFVPYVGISAGCANLKTYHHLFDVTDPTTTVFTFKETNTSWGGTVGTRYFFSNHWYGNLQLRYNDLGDITFKLNTPQAIPLPEDIDYHSDYLHEVSVIGGFGFIW